MHDYRFAPTAVLEPACRGQLTTSLLLESIVTAHICASEDPTTFTRMSPVQQQSYYVDHHDCRRQQLPDYIPVLSAYGRNSISRSGITSRTPLYPLSYGAVPDAVSPLESTVGRTNGVGRIPILLVVVTGTVHMNCGSCSWHGDVR